MLEKDKCSGCELCVTICPRQSISMRADEEGFRYPYIDMNRCNKCKLCVSMCPINNIDKIRIHTHNIKAFSGFYENADKLKKSASGGIASALAEKVISEGGIVFGVTYCDNYKNAKYIEISKHDEINLLKGSKYIHAEKGNIYKKVKTHVKQKQQVLFVGLPCEVAAVKSYLRKEYDNLITCDLICHGPTSPKVAEQYIDHLEQLHQSHLKFFSVRHKETGWTPVYMKAEFENNDIFIKPFSETEYGVAFVNMVRKSCENCSFKGDNRVSDLTIGDFWGITPSNKAYNKNGVSIILVNTEKGEKILREINEFSLSEADINLAISSNPRLNSSKPNAYRERFSDWFIRYGLFYACKKNMTFKQKIKKFIKMSTPKLLHPYMKTIISSLRRK